MKATLASLVSMSFVLLSGESAQSAPDDLSDAMASTPASVAESHDLSLYSYGKTWNVTPRVGVLGFQDKNLNYTSRILEGLTTRVNLASTLPLPNPWNLGLQTGLLYTHVGSATSNFFGDNATIKDANGSNTFLVPIEATLGYKITDHLLVAADLGSQLIYRSIPSTMHFGRDSDLAAANSVDFFPSIGADIGWAISQQVALSLRADYIPTPATGLFTATLGATIGIV